MQVIPAKSERNSAKRRGGGPRTPHGKRRSRFNAREHGIFSDVVLDDESRAEFEVLLQGLREDRQPQGLLEELVVEKIATIAWRYRRLIQAEGAEIRRSTDSFQWDLACEQEEAALQTRPVSAEDDNDEGALMWNKRNPWILERCIELLTELRQNIETDGLDKKHDSGILRRLYGRQDYLSKAPFGQYLRWQSTSEIPGEERQVGGYATPEECKRNILRYIDAEIGRLKLYQKVHVMIESHKIELERVRFRVPDGPALDRLLRYEASLEKALDRALNQLDRLQRRRLGQLVPPPIEVRVS